MESRIHREVYVRFGRGYRRDRPRKRVWRGGAYLMNAYDEIMDKIEVTPELRRRVLERIAAEDITPARAKVARFPA